MCKDFERMAVVTKISCLIQSVKILKKWAVMCKNFERLSCCI